jgi:hypothetical protein
MSVWRRKAIECLPALRKEFEQPATSIYDVFIEMLPAVVKAHKDKDNITLRMIYDFAEWCFQQKEKDLWNAAGVVFYEHLGDYNETLKEFQKWVKPKIYCDIRGLLEQRLAETDLQNLDKLYAFKLKSN